MYASCIIHICIMATCICALYMYCTCTCIVRVFVHHTYMHQGEGSRIIDICIMHTCIRKHHIYTNPGKRCIVTCIIHSGSGTRIIDASCIHTRFRIKGQDHCFVHHTRMYQDQASWINASYICASWPLVSGSIMYASYIQTSGSRIIHSCMLQDQGSWICVWIYASYIVNHTHMHQDQGY